MTEPPAATCLDDAEGKAAETVKPRKRAVVLIHGIGNQVPMETLRPFVEAVWTSAPCAKDSPKHLTWSQRDLKSDDLELWRITTNADGDGVRTDFFEFYWADMMEDTTLADVVWWLLRLFWRPASDVPPRVWDAWIVGIAMFLALAGVIAAYGFLGLLTLWAIPHSLFCAFGWLAAATGLSVGLWCLRRVVLIQFAGDAARYLTPAPSNIGARTRIRLAGLKLLRALHCDDAYDRIILVGHSLGTVVGYDLLNFCWSDINDQIHHAPASQALVAIENAGRDVRADPGKVSAFQIAQQDYFREVRRLVPTKWKISDFVTMGSPLTHAHILMVNDRSPLLDSERRAIGADWLKPWWKALDTTTYGIAAMFRARAAQRELPLCPPITQSGEAFVYDPDKGGFMVPHHAAVFAAVRWTNIFAPCQYVFKGDVVGGPVAPLFGPGVKDVPLTGAVGSQFLAHTHYWDEGRSDDAHLVALRTALDF